MKDYTLIWTVISGIVGGLVTFAGWFLTMGRKFQVLDDVSQGIKDLKSDIKDVTGEIKNLEKSLNVSNAAIIELQTLLADKGFNVRQHIIFTSHSPIQLTDYGQQLIRESGFSGIMQDEEKVRYLVSLVKAKNPQTNYDIQESAMKVMQELAGSNDPLVVPLKNYAYENGLALDLILKSAGIILRDEVMKSLRFDDSY